MSTRPATSFALCLLLSNIASAALWKDATDATVGVTAEWTNKVMVADIDGDGLLDIVYANGGNYASAGEPEPTRVFLNQGPGLAFLEATNKVFGAAKHLARVVEARDFDGDGVVDLVVGTTYETQSQFYRGLGGGAFGDATAESFPKMPLSVGDLAAGDVDGDGDLDLLLADWAPGAPASNGGGRVRLWVNDGAAHFKDVTEDQTPNALFGFSWDIELADIDNDADLDALISCKSCAKPRLYLNDGAGTFADSAGLPKHGNNYEFEAMDLTGDGFLDLVTINDGLDLRETILVNDGAGTFEDLSETLWQGEDNPGEDDNVAVFLDADSDGDADVLIGSLSGPDRLLLNDGKGLLTLSTEEPFEGPETPGTLGLAVGDLDGDGRLDVVESQGEVDFPDHVFLGDGAAVDTQAPVLAILAATNSPLGVVVVARIHDRKTPIRDTDFSKLSVSAEGSTVGDAAVSAVPVWVGEGLYRAVLALEPGSWDIEACAADAAGNADCSEAATVVVETPVVPVDEAPGEDVVELGAESDVVVEDEPDVTEPSADAVAEAEEDVVTPSVERVEPVESTDIGVPAPVDGPKTGSSTGGCQTTSSTPSPAWVLGLLALLLFLRRSQ